MPFTCFQSPYFWNCWVVVNVSDLNFEINCSLWLMYCFKEELSSCIFAVTLVKALKWMLMYMPLVIKNWQKTDNEHNFNFMVDDWMWGVCCSLGKFKFLINTSKWRWKKLSSIISAAGIWEKIPILISILSTLALYYLPLQKHFQFDALMFGQNWCLCHPCTF